MDGTMVMDAQELETHIARLPDTHARNAAVVRALVSRATERGITQGCAFGCARGSFVETYGSTDMSTAVSPGRRGAETRTPSILVVEDNMDVADSLARFL